MKNIFSMPSPTSKTLRFSANPNKSTTEDLGDTRDGCVPSRLDMFGQLAVLCTNEELGKARKVVSNTYSSCFQESVKKSETAPLGEHISM